jgi:hypothetical protein
MTNPLLERAKRQPVSPTTAIWNRAALELGGSSPAVGDLALGALLLVHGAIMNGGVNHAFDCLDSTGIGAAIDGFRYFGLHDVAALLERALKADVEERERMDAEYGRLIPDDDTLVQAFEEMFKRSPERFSPL